MRLKPGPSSSMLFELGFLKIHSAVQRNCIRLCFPAYVYSSNFAEVELELKMGM